MCDNYRDDPSLSKDTNAILRQMRCNENRRQLGHCVVWHPQRGWNVSGCFSPPSKPHPGQARLGKAGLGGARLGMAWHGMGEFRYD